MNSTTSEEIHMKQKSQQKIIGQLQFIMRKNWIWKFTHSNKILSILN